jgi:hypothetical protein
VAGGLVLCVVAVALARPYLRVLDDHPEAHRTAAQVEAFSGPVQSFVATSKLDRVWGAALRPVRHTLGSVPEQTLFPGLAALALAIVGAGWSSLRRRLRIGLGVAVLVFGVLSLGFHGSWAQWLFPYRWLFEVLPGWQGIRVPGRLMTLTSLALALLAAGGADVVIAWVQARRGSRPAVAVAAALVAVVLAEGWGFAPHPRAPVAPPGLHGLAAPVFVLPAAAPMNRRAVLWSTDDFHDLVNGRGSFIPRQFVALQALALRFPDRGSIAAFRRLGIRTVAVRHVRGASAILGRSLNGLGVEREARGGVVVYRLAP